MSADFVKYDLGQLNAGSVVEITLKHRANVQLLDASNFARYQRGENFQAVGGEAVESPVTLEAPNSGHWYVVLDLGGAEGSIESSVRVLSEA